MSHLKASERAVVLNEETSERDVSPGTSKTSAVHFLSNTVEQEQPLPDVSGTGDEQTTPSGAQSLSKAIRFPEMQ